MAIALPVYVADGTLSTPRLPAYLADGAFVTLGIWIPPYTLNAYRTDFVLPTPATGLIYFALTPTGGIVWGGGADIVGDPVIPTGGMVFGGTAPVTHWIAVAPTGGIRWAGSPSITHFFTPYLTGGIRWGGTAAPSVVYGVHVPTGGIQWGGTAEVTTDTAVITPSGGIAWGGSAVVSDKIPVIPTGGIRWGGTAEPTTVNVMPVSGGIRWGGEAIPVTKYKITPTGGIVWGGTAPVTFRESLHVPSGGFVWGGSALAYMVDSDTVLTPENPYGDKFSGWMVNIENDAASRYLDLPANSITQFGGKTYVTNAAGVYELGAEDDAGQLIKASVEFPTTDFQDSHEKKMEVAYVGVKTTGKMKMKLMVNGYDPLYFFILPSSDKHKGTRIPIGKGMTGRYWGSRIDNVKGCDFELESAEFVPVAGQRHGA